MSNKTPKNSAVKTESVPNLKIKSKYSTGLIVLFILLVIGLLSGLLIKVGVNQVTIGDQKINVSVADSSEQREKGLSGVSSLKHDSGMLFVYDSASRYCIWMKDMKFNIDVLWMGSDKKVLFIEQNLTPESYPKAYCPDKDAQYILEVPAGTVASQAVNIGDQLHF